MKIILNNEELAKIISFSNPTIFTTKQFSDKLVNLYEANLDEDLAWILEMLEEDKATV